MSNEVAEIVQLLSLTEEQVSLLKSKYQDLLDGKEDVEEPVENWKVDNVIAWLQKINLGEYVEEFKTQNIDGPQLLALKEADLKAKFSMNILGDKWKLLRERELLKEDNPSSTSLELPLSVEQVSDWLKSIGFAEYIQSCGKHKIDGPALQRLSKETLLTFKELEIKLGHKQKIVSEIEKLVNSHK